MKGKDWFGLGVLLTIALLMQFLTTRFYDFGWAQIPAVMFSAVLCALPFAIWLPAEIHRAWAVLQQRNRILGLAIPAFIFSVCLLGAFSAIYGRAMGITITLLVSALGSLLFWGVALTPYVIGLLAGTAIAIVSLFYGNIGGEPCARQAEIRKRQERAWRN